MSTGIGPDRLAELEEQRRFLLRSINDLEREHAVGDVDDEDYATLRDGYVARAAATMRDIADGKAALPPPRRRPAVVAVAVAFTIAIAAVGGWAVAHYAGQRTTDSTAVTAPNDEITRLLASARVASAQNDPAAAIDAYKRVLDIDPKNVEAITYSGWLIVTSGARSTRPDLVDAGVGQLRRAIATDPTYADAHCLLGVSLVRFVGTPDPAAAKPELDSCLANDPPAIVRQLVEPVRQSLDLTSTSASTSPADAPPDGLISSAVARLRPQ